ncbi:MAG: aspartyl/glutamyl-tRNA amidotransferase subunit C [Phycisphaerales bacterium JB050]
MTEQTPQTTDTSPQPGSLTDAEVRRVVRMARLEIAEEHIEPLREELARVLGWATMLKEVDSERLVDETRPAEARLDPDVPGQMLDHSVMETIAPETDGPFIRVRMVLGGGGGA